MFRYDLTLGMPHTNRHGLAEHLLLMHAGHLQWTSIGRTIGRPLSRLRTLDDGEVYGTFFFIEEHFPAQVLPNTFTLDDTLTFLVFLRAYKNLAVEGRILFDLATRLADFQPVNETFPAAAAVEHPWIRFANIFITPDGGNSRLRVAPPAEGDFSAFVPLPMHENPYRITKQAEETGTLELFDGSQCLDVRKAFAVPYQIDPDRDSNGAGLYYFANYVPVMDRAERAAMRENSARPFSANDLDRRILESRRIAYYGNALLSDRLLTEVSVFAQPGDPRRVGFRYVIRREQDDKTICLSEAIKILPPAV